MTLRVAITGASGFIGTNVLRFYLDKGVDVINLDKKKPVDIANHKYWRKTDILNFNELRKAIYEFAPTYLIHLAARTDLDEKKNITGYAANIEGVENLLNAVREYGGIKRIIFASSMLVCRRGHIPRDEYDYMPSTLYGESKVLGEKLVRENTNILPEWVIIRPTSIWGPWFGVPYYHFFNIIIKRRYFSLGNNAATGTFGYIKNVVLQIDKLLFEDKLKVNHKMFYLGDYESLNISDWADKITEALNEKPFKVFPMFMFNIAAAVGDILAMMNFKKFPMNSFRLKNMTENNIIDLYNISQIVPVLPYSVEEGIRETLEWMKGNMAKT